MNPNDLVTSITNCRTAHATSSIALVVNLPAATGVRPIITDSGIPNSSVGLVARPSCNAPLRLGIGTGLHSHSERAHVAPNARADGASATFNGKYCNVVLPIPTGSPRSVNGCVAEYQRLRKRSVRPGNNVLVLRYKKQHRRQMPLQ